MKSQAILIAVLVLCSFAALAQTNPPQQPARPEPTFVDFTGFKGKIIEVKNRDPRDLVSILAPLGSGFKGSAIQANFEMKTITVRDFPENIATIEEAIKRLDTPKPPKSETPRVEPVSIELHLHVLLAHNVDAAKTGNAPNYPAEITDVLKQLEATIKFKNYHLLTSTVQRVMESRPLQGTGIVAVGNPLFEKTLEPVYKFSAGRILSNDFQSKEPVRMQINNFSFEIEDREHLFGKAYFANDLAIREGEKLVVGTASLKDKALVLVLTVKVIK